MICAPDLARPLLARSLQSVSWQDPEDLQERSLSKISVEAPSKSSDGRGHRFVRACAVHMHMDIAQEQFCV